MAVFIGRRGDDPPEKRSPGAGSTGAMSFGGDIGKNSRERAKAQRKTVTVALAVIHDSEAGDQFVPVKGRALWALRHLIAAGDAGCTPINTPGPRWSDYVFKLRRAGISVETITEMHGGPYAGHHARYVLRSKVTLREPAELREAAHDRGHSLPLLCGQRRGDGR